MDGNVLEDTENDVKQNETTAATAEKCSDLKETTQIASTAAPEAKENASTTGIQWTEEATAAAAKCKERNEATTVAVGKAEASAAAYKAKLSSTETQRTEYAAAVTNM